MTPFEKAKVKQLREEAKKKEKSETRSVAVDTTQEDVSPEADGGTKEGTKASLTSMLEINLAVLLMVSRRRLPDGARQLLLRQT